MKSRLDKAETYLLDMVINEQQLDADFSEWMTGNQPDDFFQDNIYPSFFGLCSGVVYSWNNKMQFTNENEEVLTNECVSFAYEHLYRQMSKKDKRTWTNVKAAVLYLAGMFLMWQYRRSKMQKRNFGKTEYIEDYIIIMNEEDGALSKYLVEELSYTVDMISEEKENYERLKSFWSSYNFDSDRYREVVKEIFNVIEEGKLAGCNTVRNTVSKRVTNGKAAYGLFDKWLETSKLLFADRDFA